ncbi:MAG: hypothetical protein M5U28_27340 [Sandaracinaceae bacterium]|nr:hypothetical protein [Sandaracinaceae bacterium]
MLRIAAVEELERLLGVPLLPVRDLGDGQHLERGVALGRGEIVTLEEGPRGGEGVREAGLLQEHARAGDLRGRFSLRARGRSGRQRGEQRERDGQARHEASLPRPA